MKTLTYRPPAKRLAFQFCRFATIRKLFILQVIISLGCSVGAIGILTYLFVQNEKDLRSKDRPYKKYYTVYRPDDPRIANLRARPQYYNPDGAIPDVQKTHKADVMKWHGETSNPTMPDGSSAKHLTLKNPT